MQLIKLFALTLCLVSCSTQEEEECVMHYALLDGSSPQVSSDFKRSEDGYSYSHSKFTPGADPDIIQRDEEGKILNSDTENEELVVKGAYSYKIGSFEFVVMYTADKNGYRPKIYWKKFPCIVSLSPTQKLLQNLSG